MRTHRVMLSVLTLAAIAFSLAGCLSTGDPIAILSAAAITGAAPLDVRFDLSYCTHPRDVPMQFCLAFGDSSEPECGTAFDVLVPHTYDVPGTYSAILTITDENGGQARDALTITVSRDGPPVGTHVGSTAPDFTAHSTEGGEITLSDYAGRVVVLDFWGAWCSPCRASMPHLDALIAAFSEDDVVAIVISTDAIEQDAIDFLNAGGYDRFLSVWEPGEKARSPLTQLYGVDSSAVGVPRTYLLDRQGVIRAIEHPLDVTESMIRSLL